jgi:Flp pilus assembly protein TadD
MRARLLILVAGLAGLAAPVAAQSSPEGELVFNTGLTHLREGRTELAIESFRKAIKTDGKSPYFHKALGVAYLQYADRCAPADRKCRTSRLEEAVSAARKALELNPYYTDARNDLGAALLALGRRDEGRQELLKAYEDPMNPTPELSARNLGQAWFEDKNYVQAESWFRTAVRRNSGYVDAQIALADSLIQQNRQREAMTELEAAAEAAPGTPALLLALGQVYLDAGRFEAARARLEEAAAKDPGGPAGRRAVELLRRVPR